MTLRIRLAALATLAAAGCTLAVPAAATPTAATPAPAHTADLRPLTDLAVRRLQLGDTVAAAKFGTATPIDDPVREQQVLADVTRRSIAIGLDPAVGTTFFRDQIEASKVVQRGLFARWTAHPEQAPATRPDLSKIRPQLDAITGKVLTQLLATTDVRAHPLRCRVDLLAAGLTASVQDRLDHLHRTALAEALHRVCP